MASKTVEDALKLLKLGKAALQKQRDRERADLRFQVPDLQWDAEAGLARKATEIDGVKIPARPMISIPKLDQPIQLLLNQEKAAHLGVNVHPLSEDADDDTAEIIQGLYRKIEQDSRAGLARSWAFDRAVKAGMGWYRVGTKYCDYSDNPSDQDITIERIFDGASVTPDPSAQEPDYSDGEWAFVEAWVPWERYKRKFKDTKLAKLHWDEVKTAGDGLSLVEIEPEWVSLGDEHPAVLVVEYWRKEYTEASRDVLGEDGKVAFTRNEPAVTVKWSTLNGMEEIDEPQEWNGKYIPLIPVIGRELQPFDGERRWVGVIGPAKSAAQMFNYAASNALEIAATESKTKVVMLNGQQEGFEQMWQQANVRNLPYLLVNPLDVQGNPAPPVQMLQQDTSKLQTSMLLLEKADQFIQASTSTFEPSLGMMPTKDRSGKAIERLQQQSDAGNSHFLYNLAEVSMTYEAKVVIDLMRSVYDRPGRIARILDFEDETATVMLNQPFVMDQQKRPQAAPPARPGMPAPKNVKQYDLTKGVYGVDVSIGKSFQTRMQQGSEVFGTLLAENPALVPLLGPIWFKFRDEPGMKEASELLKKMRSKQFPGIDAEEGEQPDAQQLQAQLEAAGQENQILKQQLQAAAQEIETDKAKQQAQLQKAQMDNAAKSELAQLKEQAESQRQQQDEDFKVFLERMKEAHDREMEEIKAQHQQEQARQQAIHGAMAQNQGHQHELESGDVSHEQALEQSEVGHQHTVQQIKAKPKPNGKAAQ
jgi:portal protein